MTDILITRHKNSASASNPWWFWGRPALRQLRRQPHRLRPQHQVLRDDPQRQPDLPRPPVVLARHGPRSPDGPGLGRAAAARWNERLRSSSRTPSRGTARGGSTTRPTRRWPRWTSPTDSLTRLSWPGARRATWRSSSTTSPRARGTFARVGPAWPRTTTPGSRSSARACSHTHEHALDHVPPRARPRGPARTVSTTRPRGPGTDRGSPSPTGSTPPAETRSVAGELTTPARPSAWSRSSSHRPGRRRAATLPRTRRRHRADDGGRRWHPPPPRPDGTAVPWWSTLSAVDEGASASRRSMPASSKRRRRSPGDLLSSTRGGAGAARPSRSRASTPSPTSRSTASATQSHRGDVARPHRPHARPRSPACLPSPA